VLEKVPLLVLAAGISVAAFSAQRSAAAMVEGLPLPWRLGNAVIAYARYLGKILWPAKLAVFYPLVAKPPALSAVLGAALLLAVLTAIVVWQARRRPYLAIGWLWFVGTLVPVIGIIQVGSQSLADRYTYLPSIGLTVAVVWAVADASRRMSAAPVGIGAAVVLILMTCTWIQVGYWRDTLTLFSRAIDVTGPDNNLAQWYVAVEYARQGNEDEALAHYREALRVLWHNPRAHYNVGNILSRRGDVDGAIAHYQAAVDQDPQLAQGYYNLGAMYGRKGDLARAEAYFAQALKVDPNMDLARHGLERVRALRGQ
jgi:protein O-mannosyl-transferase